MKQLLPFKVGYEKYALDLSEVQEIVEQSRIDPFHGSPDVVAGAIGFHGRIVPLLDMPKFLNFPTGKIGSRMIVLVNDRGPMALGVDQVGSIINLDLSDFKPVQNYSERKYLSDTINWAGSMIGLLDLNQVLAELDRLCDGAGG